MVHKSFKKFHPLFVPKVNISLEPLKYLQMVKSSSYSKPYIGMVVKLLYSISSKDSYRPELIIISSYYLDKSVLIIRYQVGISTSFYNQDICFL